MSHNVLKISKQQSQPTSPTPATLIPANTSLQLQHHPSLDGSKERDSIPNIKDIQPHTTTSQTGIKKLAFLLDPRKDLHLSVSPNHASPKSFLGPSTKSSKLKVSTSSPENSNLNLISPKDLVRLAMSKHKPKATVKKVTVQSSTSIPKNMRKSLSLRFAPGMIRSEKREGSTSKLTSTSIVEDNSALSKTTMPAPQDKAAKLKRMKLIYNDNSQSDIGPLTKSTVYTPQEVSGRMWQGTLSPNRSNSGLLWPGSPNGTVSTGQIKNQFYVNPVGFGNSDKTFFGKHNMTTDEDKAEKSYRKRASVEQIGSYLKEFKPLAKQPKRQEKKGAQTRAMTSMDNPKASSVSFSRLMSNHTITYETVERAKSPTEGLKGGDDEEMDETHEVLGHVEEVKTKEVKPREEFIADLKNWVNDIVKPQEENVLLAQKKNSAAAEKVKEAQEGLLEKLRGALENDEFVRREDYERLYRERDCIEDELDAVKEENAQLRTLLWKIQEENEAREQREIEEREAKKKFIHEYELSPQIQEALRELETLRRRENVVKDLLKMVYRAGIQIGDLEDCDITKESPGLQEEQQYAYQQGPSHYIDNSNSYYTTSAKQDQIKQKYEHDKYNLQPIGENIYKEENGIEDDSYNHELPEQSGEYYESEESSHNVIALSEMGDSAPASSNRQHLEMLATGSPTGLVSTVLKTSSNPKSTADSSPKFSAQLGTPQSWAPSSGQGKLKLDLTGLGGNQARPRVNTVPVQSSTEKISNYIMTDQAQALGFHEEFMSKLEEFSLSWRQDALNYQKF